MANIRVSTTVNTFNPLRFAFEKLQTISQTFHSKQNA